MSRKIISLILIIAAAGVALAAVVQSRTKPRPTHQYVISGPYNHKNLTVFLVHGKSDLSGKTPITLEEGLQQKKVKVRETKNVNQLTIENASTDELYVQAGDIVKGGQQDRTLAYDLILPPRSGRVPIDAFCVEAGRWAQRGSESAETFSMSTAVLSSKELKLAAKSSKEQSKVWEKVEETQTKLARNVQPAKPVPGRSEPQFSARALAPASPTSLQLTLDNSDVRRSAAEYSSKLKGLIDGKPDVVGYVFAINGEVNSADIYASHELFVKLWPKLLMASANEAVAEFDDAKTPKPVTSEQVRSSLASAERGTRSVKQVTPRVQLVTHEAEKELFFETRDRDRQDAWIHRNYLAK